MKIVHRNNEVKERNLLEVAFDIGKLTLSWFTLIHRDGGRSSSEYSGSVQNRMKPLRKLFSELESLAIESGFDGLFVCCEPTGGFERNLVRLSHELGHLTSYVSPESVKKLKVVEGNDPTKSDEKDPRVIHILQELGKTIKCRQLPAKYQTLRELSSYYEDLTLRNVEIRGQLSTYLYRLFPDFSLKAKTLYQKTGEAVLKEFCFNPQRIAELTWAEFVNRVRLHCKRASISQLEEIYKDAQSSKLHVIPDCLARTYELQLVDTFEEWRALADRRDQLKGEMIALVETLEEYRKMSKLVEHFSRFLFARLIAETGPLSDFRHWKQLQKYAGLNLCMRQSGQQKGHIKISKKGRALMRKVLYQIVNTHLTNRRKKAPALFLEYYEKQFGGREILLSERDLPKGSHYRARTCVMRKFLKAFLGIYQSPVEFSMERLMKCESEFAEVA